MKKGKKKEDNTIEQLAPVRLVVDRRVEAGLYLQRMTSLTEAATLVTELMDRVPEGWGAAVDAAAQRLEGLLPVINASIRRSNAKSNVPIAKARNTLMTAWASMRTALTTISNAEIGALAGEAKAVTQEVFGDGVPDISKLRPRQAWGQAGAFLETLDASPELRGRLDALVHRPVVEWVRETHAVLGSALKKRVGKAPSPDARAVLTHVHQHIDHYVACLLATAEPGDDVQWAKVEVALEALANVRADTARRRGKASAEVEGDVEPDAEEVDDSDAEDGGDAITQPEPPVKPAVSGEVITKPAVTATPPTEVVVT